MTFWTDVIRVAGAVAAPVLISTGVGAPLGLAIGAVTTGVGNGIADEIEKKEAREAADREAARLREENEKKLADAKAQADKRAREVAEEFERQKEYETRPVNVLNACRNNELSNLPALLQALDDKQFDALGLQPVAAATSQEAREAIQGMLEAERVRRKL